MDTIRNDVVYALRSLWRSPGVTLAAVVCLALGIGATATMYSALRALVLRPVPVEKSDRVVRVSEMPPNAPAGTDGTSAGTFNDWRQLDVFRRIAGYRWAEVSLTGVAEPERVRGSRVTPQFFSIVSGRALHGRTLVEGDAEPGRDAVVVLSHGLWTRRFASDARVIGRSVLIDGAPHEVVGVLPREFVFPPGTEIFLPLSLSGEALLDRRSNGISVIAELAPGVSIERARARVVAAQQQVVREFPDVRRDWTAVVEPVQKFTGSNARPYVVMSFISVSFILLIGCANVANLLLARATGREREMAVRTAMGASRARIVRLLLTESFVLALIGGIAGVLIALWGVLIFRNSIPAELIQFNPGWTSIRVNPATLAFAFSAAMVSSLLFGVLPAWHASRDNLQSTMRDNARGTVGGRLRNRTRNALVVVEIAMAMMLVVSTGLMLKSFRALLNADPGFQRENVLTMQISLSRGENYDTDEERAAFYAKLSDRLASLPTVRAASLVSVLPMDWNDAQTRMTDDARPAAAESDQPIVRTRTVSANFFATMGIVLKSGREFDQRDRIGSPPVVIISDQLARAVWPNANPIGKRIRLLGRDTWHEVIGVVEDVRHNPNTGPAVQPTVHMAVQQNPAFRMSAVLRTSGDPIAVASAVRREVSQLDNALAAGDVRTLDRVIFNALAPQRTTAGMLGIFGVIALVLACVGVYGVMSYSVAARASELGVRLALGAHSRDVLNLIMRQGGVLTALGISGGLIGAYLMSRGMRALMFDAGGTDFITFGAATLFLSAMSLFACYVPARRAARTDPTMLLRNE